MQTLNRISDVFVPHPIGGEAALEEHLLVLVRATEVLHHPTHRLLGRLRLRLRYVGIDLGGGQVLQANAKLFALGLDLPNAAVPLPPQSVNGAGLG